MPLRVHLSTLATFLPSFSAYLPTAQDAYPMLSIVNSFLLILFAAHHYSLLFTAAHPSSPRFPALSLTFLNSSKLTSYNEPKKKN